MSSFDPHPTKPKPDFVGAPDAAQGPRPAQDDDFHPATLNAYRGPRLLRREFPPQHVNFGTC